MCQRRGGTGARTRAKHFGKRAETGPWHPRGMSDPTRTNRALLLPARVLAPARRLLRRLVERAPRPVQRLAASALHRLVGRWPLLEGLLGLAPQARAPERPPQSEAPAREDRQATLALVAALRDPAAEIAASAAEALREHPAELAVPALREVLENRDGYFSSPARAAAVRSLGTLLPCGDDALLTAAVRDGDADVSLAAIGAFVERDEEASAGALLNLLEDTSGFYLPVTRRAAARGLSNVHCADERRVGALLGIEPDPAVREALASVGAAARS